jgi:hypothetical protein
MKVHADNALEATGMSAEVLITGAIAILVYQLFVTARVVFSSQYSAKQRVAQVAIIWLVPLFGAVICHNFVVADTRRRRARDTSFTEGGGDSPPGAGSA